MQNIKKYLEEKAKESYEYELRNIPKRVKAFYDAEYICNKWMFGDLERSYSCNTLTAERVYFPFSIYLKLSPNDDICTECMLFLEEIEEERKIEFDDYYISDEDALKCFSSNYLYIHFIQHGEGKCRILYRTEEKLVTQKERFREVVCL
jgi:hypothetical protein